MKRREVRRASMLKDLHCQSTTSRVFDDKDVFREVSKISGRRVCIKIEGRLPIRLAEGRARPGSV
jgi:hypothetical protein